MAINLALTSGEPAGIGPDICLQLAHDADFIREIHHTCPDGVQINVLGSRTVLAERAKKLNLPMIPEFEGTALFNLLHVDSPPAKVGAPSPVHADYVVALINRAVEGCWQKHHHAIVTAPIQKSTIVAGGYPSFQGHTEYLAEFWAKLSGTPPSSLTPLMMLTQPFNAPLKASLPPLRVCLATTHIPLSRVPSALHEPNRLMAVARVLAEDFTKKYSTPTPTIALLGLNPHAGEDGKIGDEEIRLLIPLMNTLRHQWPQINWQGPLSADTAFITERRADIDVYWGLYHDQVLPVFKALTFGGGVNVTLGLPFIRTSVDHGTALSLAGTGRAKTDGLRSAIIEAIYLAHQRPLS